MENKIKIKLELKDGDSGKVLLTFLEETKEGKFTKEKPQKVDENYSRLNLLENIYPDSQSYLHGLI